MHDALTQSVEAAGWSERYVQLVCGIEDMERLAAAGVHEGSIDCIVSIQTLCSVTDPAVVAKQLYKLLKPGGELTFHEHHQNKDIATSLVQRLWDPLWSLLIG